MARNSRKRNDGRKYQAAIIPKPLAWKAARPGPYIQRRGGHIAAAAGTVRRDGLADCVL